MVAPDGFPVGHRESAITARAYDRDMGTSSTRVPEAGYALAYGEAQRGLEDQERTVVELRARAGTLNRRQLRILMMAFRLGALLLVAEVLAWVVALVVRG
jgi:hypothetical protein